MTTFPLHNFRYAIIENRQVIADVIEKKLLEKLTLSDESEILIILSIALHLHDFFVSRDFDENAYFWRSISKHIFDSYHDKFEYLYPKHFWLCYDAVIEGKASVADFIKWYGVDALFIRELHPPLMSWRRIPLVQVILNDLSHVIYPVNRSIDRGIYARNLFALLKDIGNTLLSLCPISISRDLMQSQPMYFLDSLKYFKSESQKKLLTSTQGIDADIIFSLFVILAIYVETKSDGFQSLDMPYELKVIDQILRIRLNILSDIEIEVEFDGYGFNSEQKETMRKWLSHEINFVEG